MISSQDTKRQLTEKLLQQKQAFQRDPYPNYLERIARLNKLKALLLDNQEALIQAMSDDFGHRSVEDAKIGDILTTVTGINYAIKHLKKWMKKDKRHVGLVVSTSQSPC